MKDIKINLLKLFKLSFLSLSVSGMVSTAYANNDIGKSLSELIAMQKTGETFENMKSAPSCTYYYKDIAKNTEGFFRLVATIKREPEIHIHKEYRDNINGTWQIKTWNSGVGAVTEKRYQYPNSQTVALMTLSAPNLIVMSYGDDNIKRKIALLPSGFYGTGDINSTNPYYVPGC